jgi:putative transposase
MKRSQFSEEQIIGILKEHEAGVPVADLCPKHGVSDASIYIWKARFGGRFSASGRAFTSYAACQTRRSLSNLSDYRASVAIQRGVSRRSLGGSAGSRSWGRGGSHLCASAHA